MFYEIKDNFILLKIKVQPQSNKNSFCGLYGDTLKVKVKAPAIEGKANKELINFLSKSFKVPKSSFELLSGATSKTKLLKFPLNKRFLDFIQEQGLV